MRRRRPGETALLDSDAGPRELLGIAGNQRIIMHFIAAGLTDVGLEREHNEDSFCILSQHGLFIVADGMGGHRAGDVASRLATHSIAAFFDSGALLTNGAAESDDPAMADEFRALVEGIKLANHRIFQTSVRHREVQGMGTTVVGAVLSHEDGKLCVAHVGDSRAYRVRDEQITQLTRDHSLVNDYLLVMPNLSDAQKGQLPSNVITRALGMQEAVAVDVHVDDTKPGDAYLLCSDGLNGMVSDELMRDILVDAGDDVESAAEKLIIAANKAGGEDNITVVVFRVAGQR